MGFGILFLGYFLTLNFEFKGINIPPDFLGYIFMMVACSKLTPYSNNFKYTLRCLIPLTVLSAGLTTMEVMAAISPNLAFPYIADIMNMSSAHYLTALFKKLVGISPTEYIARHKHLIK